VSGQIVKMPLRVGTKVKKGELLVRLSAAEINAKVRAAKTQMEQVERNLARESKLQKVQASTPERVRTLKEQLEISKAAYREAKAMLDYTEIRAPFDATITKKIAQQGDLAAPGRPLLQLENGKALEVLIQVPETQAQDLKLGDRLAVTVPAAKLELSAAVREISPTVDPASRTTQVKLTLPDNPLLKSGQFARVSLADRRAKTLLIDEGALHLNGQMELVFIAEGGKAHLRLVRSGARVGGRVEILSGLKPGDRIIVKSAGRLHEGQPLDIVEAAAIK